MIVGGNLEAINLSVDATDKVGVDNISKIETMINKILKAQEIIQNYATSSDNEEPSLSDYEDLWITGVNASNLTVLNQVVADTYSTAVDTLSEIQSLVDNL